MFDSSIILSIAAAALSILGGLLANIFHDSTKLWLLPHKPTTPPTPYKQRMATLTRGLVESSADIDRILNEMIDVSREREMAIANLENQLETLAEREKQLQEKIDTLEKVPLPAIEHFVSALEKGEKQSAWRDYILFGLGVIVSTVIAIVLKLLFGI